MGKKINASLCLRMLMTVSFIVLLCGTGTVAAAEKTGPSSSLEKKDSNGDGKIDTWIQRDADGSLMMIASTTTKCWASRRPK